MNLKKKFYLLVHPDNNEIDQKYLMDFLISDKIFRVFTIFWIFYIVSIYNQRIALSEQQLFVPILDFQKLIIPSFPSFFYFYSIVIIGIITALWSIKNKIIFPRIILLFCVLWLNAFQWSFGAISHSGHLLVLTHFFSIFLVYKSGFDLRSFVTQIKFFQFGILSTYSLAGLWKFIFLIRDTIVPKEEYTTWLDPNSVKRNAIVNLLSKDYIAEGWMARMYDIPFLWQMSAIFVFIIQLIAVLAVIKKKWSYIIVSGLIIFHLYNQYFTLTYFYPAIFTLIIVFFPYHLILKNETARYFK